MLTAVLASLAFLAPAATVATPSAAPAVEARVPFPQYRLRNFQAGRGPESRDVVYLETTNRRWYRAELLGNCLNLPFANAIGIDTRGSRTLDRFSAVIVEGDRCPIQSLVEVPGPPKKRG